LREESSSMLCSKITRYTSAPGIQAAESRQQGKRRRPVRSLQLNLECAW
jgi:hypothetical protein